MNINIEHTECPKLNEFNGFMFNNFLIFDNEAHIFNLHILFSSQRIESTDSLSSTQSIRMVLMQIYLFVIYIMYVFRYQVIKHEPSLPLFSPGYQLPTQPLLLPIQLQPACNVNRNFGRIVHSYTLLANTQKPKPKTSISLYAYNALMGK